MCIRQPGLFFFLLSTLLSAIRWFLSAFRDLQPPCRALRVHGVPLHLRATHLQLGRQRLRGELRGAPAGRSPAPTRRSRPVKREVHRWLPFCWLCSKNRWVPIPGLPGGLFIYQGNPSISPKRTRMGRYRCIRCISLAPGFWFGGGGWWKPF